MQSLRQRWFERFIQASLTRPGRVVACFALLGLGGALLAARLEFRGSFVELLPAGAREVQDLTRVSQKAGGDGYLVLRAQGAAPEQLKAYAQELQGRLERRPQVRYVEHHFDVGFFLRNGLLLMPAAGPGQRRAPVRTAGGGHHPAGHAACIGIGGGGPAGGRGRAAHVRVRPVGDWPPERGDGLPGGHPHWVGH